VARTGRDGELDATERQPQRLSPVARRAWTRTAASRRRVQPSGPAQAGWAASPRTPRTAPPGGPPPRWPRLTPLGDARCVRGLATMDLSPWWPDLGPLWPDLGKEGVRWASRRGSQSASPVWGRSGGNGVGRGGGSGGRDREGGGGGRRGCDWVRTSVRKCGMM
jgi:hypothetical protein